MMSKGGYGIDITELEYNPFINSSIYKGENYKIAGRIQRLRLSLLIHSRIYYSMDSNLISDKVWDTYAKELVFLQETYPEESRLVVYYEAFRDWDASSGAFLPLNDPWVIRNAERRLFL